MTACPPPGRLVDDELGRIATQYREAERLIGYARAVLGQVEAAALDVCAIPSKFDLDTAVGHQLTLLGKRLGWPRKHARARLLPVYGIECEGDECETLQPIAGACEEATWEDCDGPRYGDSFVRDIGLCEVPPLPIYGVPFDGSAPLPADVTPLPYGISCEGDPRAYAGPCDEGGHWVDCPPASGPGSIDLSATFAGPCDAGTWADCPQPGSVECEVGPGREVFDDDELYRRYLKARRYQVLGLYDVESLKAALRLIWGPEAFVADLRAGEVVVASGRALTKLEKTIAPLTAAVLPVAPGIRLGFHVDPGPILGIGFGWGHGCDEDAYGASVASGAKWLNPQYVN